MHSHPLSFMYLMLILYEQQQQLILFCASYFVLYQVINFLLFTLFSTCSTFSMHEFFLLILTIWGIGLKCKRNEAQKVAFKYKAGKEYNDSTISSGAFLLDFALIFLLTSFFFLLKFFVCFHTQRRAMQLNVRQIVFITVLSLLYVYTVMEMNFF